MWCFTWAANRLSPHENVPSVGGYRRTADKGSMRERDGTLQSWQAGIFDRPRPLTRRVWAQAIYEKRMHDEQAPGIRAVPYPRGREGYPSSQNGTWTWYPTSWTVMIRTPSSALIASRRHTTFPDAQIVS